MESWILKRKEKQRYSEHHLGPACKLQPKPKHNVSFICKYVCKRKDERHIFWSSNDNSDINIQEATKYSKFQLY